MVQNTAAVSCGGFAPKLLAEVFRSAVHNSEYTDVAIRSHLSVSRELRSGVAQKDCLLYAVCQSLSSLKSSRAGYVVVPNFEPTVSRALTRCYPMEGRESATYAANTVTHRMKARHETVGRRVPITTTVTSERNNLHQPLNNPW